MRLLCCFYLSLYFHLAGQFEFQSRISPVVHSDILSERPSTSVIINDDRASWGTSGNLASSLKNPQRSSLRVDNETESRRQWKTKIGSNEEQGVCST